MSIEYQDGSFSENMPISEAFTKFKQDMERMENPAKALYVGTPSELEEIKARSKNAFKFDDETEEEKADLQSQIDDLKEKVGAMKPVKSKYIHIPTDEERKVMQDILEANKREGIQRKVL